MTAAASSKIFVSVVMQLVQPTVALRSDLTVAGVRNLSNAAVPSIAGAPANCSSTLRISARNFEPMLGGSSSIAACAGAA